MIGVSGVGGWGEGEMSGGRDGGREEDAQDERRGRWKG